MIQQVAFKLKPQSRGFHLITDDVLRHLLQLPKKGRLNLGTWQGIYLCEFRNGGGNRHIVATILE